MTRDDIIRMAREAGATPYTNRHYPDRPTHTFTIEQLAAFAELVRKDYSTAHANLWLDRIHKFMLAEREACAKLCENMPLEWEDQPSIAQAELATMMDCAIAIRARGQA